MRQQKENAMDIFSLLGMRNGSAGIILESIKSGSFLCPICRKNNLHFYFWKRDMGGEIAEIKCVGDFPPCLIKSDSPIFNILSNIVFECKQRIYYDTHREYEIEMIKLLLRLASEIKEN